MVAAGALCGGLGADVLITADYAFPGYGFVTFPQCAVLDVVEHALEAVVVALLDGGDGAEMVGDFSEAFLIGHSGGLGVEFVAVSALLFERKLEIVDSCPEVPGIDTC